MYSTLLKSVFFFKRWMVIGSYTNSKIECLVKVVYRTVVLRKSWNFLVQWESFLTPFYVLYFTANDVYIEESHGLGEYPILAKVRTRLTDGNLYGWYSDAVGSSMAVYPNYPRWTWSAFVIYGYSNETFRVWASSLDRGKHYSYICWTELEWLVNS